LIYFSLYSFIIIAISHVFEHFRAADYFAALYFAARAIRAIDDAADMAFRRYDDAASPY